VDAAVAVNVLDHLTDPSAAVAEAHRALAPGGVFLAATASRHDSPELAAVWRPPPSSFDAEDGPGLVAAVFPRVEAERWDAPLIRLPDRDAVRDYLIAVRGPPGCGRRRRPGAHADHRHQAGRADLGPPLSPRRVSRM
jgi:SAM-dependent methyltransferase